MNAVWWPTGKLSIRRDPCFRAKDAPSDQATGVLRAPLDAAQLAAIFDCDDDSFCDLSYARTKDQDRPGMRGYKAIGKFRVLGAWK